MESSQKDEENSSELTTKDQENWGARNNDQKFINWESSLEPSFEWDRAYSDTPHISVSSAYEDPREVQGGSGERSREPWMPEMLYNRMGAEPYDETQKELWTVGSRGGCQEIKFDLGNLRPALASNSEETEFFQTINHTRRGPNWHAHTKKALKMTNFSGHSTSEVQESLQFRECQNS
ncbi:hypothetical protein B0H14DRAFT_2585483 [Mycena olivaceomarginata]|nr:hypothetical protein B0H14DRAFT_2585483 [Mycena olivaceomarginata]